MDIRYLITQLHVLYLHNQIKNSISNALGCGISAVEVCAFMYTRYIYKCEDNRLDFAIEVQQHI